MHVRMYIYVFVAVCLRIYGLFVKVTKLRLAASRRALICEMLHLNANNTFSRQNNVWPRGD